MERFGLTHFILLGATLLFLAGSSFLVSKLPKRWQDAAFVLAAALCAGGIFFRYAMGLKFSLDIDMTSLGIQMLQVCNFNFILVLLMLIPGLHIARQYAVYFSMFAASTTLFSLNADWVNYAWYDVYILNSWLYHVFAVCVPLWMLASGRVKPEKKYLFPVSGCVFLYFTVVYAVCEALKSAGIMSPNGNFSFIYGPKGAPILAEIYALIPLPYYYLYPVFILAVVFFAGFMLIFSRKLTFDPNGGRGKIKRSRETVGSRVNVPYYPFERIGYRFVGYSEDASGNELISPGDDLIMPKKNLTLYAIWEERSPIKEKPKDDDVNLDTQAEDSDESI